MTEEAKEKDLINNWILNELAILQQEYFQHLEKKEINFAITKLIKFTRERLSNEYLELTKISPWGTDTKKTVLFVYQQLLIMLHPATPFITEYLYQKNTQQEILSGEVEKININSVQQKNNLWKIDCLLILVNNIRNFRQKNKVEEFYLELLPEWKKKLIPSFDFNYFCEPLTKSRLFILEEKKNGLNSFIDLPPFGVLWYQEKVDAKELEKKLSFYQKECEIIKKNWLENSNFLAHASPQAVAEKKEKLIYYQEQEKKLQAELKKIYKI